MQSISMREHIDIEREDFRLLAVLIGIGVQGCLLLTRNSKDGMIACSD